MTFTEVRLHRSTDDNNNMRGNVWTGKVTFFYYFQQNNNDFQHIYLITTNRENCQVCRRRPCIIMTSPMMATWKGGEEGRWNYHDQQIDLHIRRMREEDEEWKLAILIENNSFLIFGFGDHFDLKMVNDPKNVSITIQRCMYRGLG